MKTLLTHLKKLKTTATKAYTKLPKNQRLALPAFIVLFATVGVYMLMSSQAAPLVTTTKSGNWNDATVWSTNQIPKPTEHAVIAAGHTLTYNLPQTKVSGITVQQSASLTFAPSTTATLETDRNVIINGKLVMKPSSPTINHTLRFINVNEEAFVGGGMDPIDSDVGLWVMGAGQLDIQGAEKKGWLHAASGITAGANNVALKETPTGWRTGDEIIITPTEEPDYDNGGERNNRTYEGFHKTTITAISGSTVTFADPTTHPHPKVNSKWTPEVMNMTRNVNIEGTGDGSVHPSNNGRAHIFIRSSQPQKLNYLALRHLAPRQDNGRFHKEDRLSDGVLGRYGLHFHHSGDGSRDTTAKGIVARDIGNHTYVPHASHGITFNDCIGFDTFNNTVWWDSGDSEATHDTLFDHCLMARAKGDPLSSGNRLNGYTLKQGLNNTVRNSVAVGILGKGDASGFNWPEGTSSVGGSGVWGFHDNISHNNRVHGIFVWQNTDQNHIIRDFVAYHNGDAGIDHGAYGNQYQYIDVELFKNAGAGVENHAAGNVSDYRDDGYGMAFERINTTSHLLTGLHNNTFDAMILYKDVNFPWVKISNSKHPSRYDFVNSGLEPDDFTFDSPLPGTVGRVQRQDKTSFSFDHNGNFKSIAPFYDLKQDTIGQTVLSDDFTGSNGSAWNSSKWQTNVSGGTADIQNNQGRLQFESGSTGRAQAIAKMPQTKDVDLVVKVTPDLGSRGHLRLVLRGSGNWHAHDTPTSGYEIEKRTDRGYASVYKIVNGQRTELMTSGGNRLNWPENDKTYWLRFQVKGNQIKARNWHAGRPEPSLWKFEVTDDSVQEPGVFQTGFYRTSGVMTAFLDDLIIRDISAPLIHDTAAHNVSNASAKIRWYTDVPATGQVEYGTSPCPCPNKINSTAGTSVAHSADLSNLIAGATYHYRVTSTANGKTSTSPTKTFIATGEPQPQPEPEPTPDPEPTPTKPGDVNGDNKVDISDLSILLTNWNSTTFPDADLNNDGIVNISDLSILLSNWGK